MFGVTGLTPEEEAELDRIEAVPVGVTCSSEPLPVAGFGILFLDVDGVLNSGRFLHGGTPRPVTVATCPAYRYGAREMLDPAAIARLNAVTDATGAGIVLATSWTVSNGGLAGMRCILGCRGVRAPVLDRVARVDIGGEAITAWLAAHPEVQRYAVLADARIWEGPRFVYTSFAEGLQDEHVPMLIEQLLRSEARDE